MSGPNGKAQRTVRRVVVMRDLTPSRVIGGSGYLLAGDTNAEIEVCAEGLKIRAKGRRGEPWRLLRWSEAWLNAAEET